MIDQQQDLEMVNEGSTVYLSGTVTDHLGVAIPLASMSTLKVYVSPESAPTSYINSRNGQSILNANGGTLAATGGAWTLKLGALDNPIVNSALPYERHRILVTWTYNAGVDGGSKEFTLPIRNLAQV